MQQAGCAQADLWDAERATRGERRSSRREPIDSLVYVDLQPNNGGVLLDLNPAGMRISVAQPLKVNLHVRFSFALSASVTIEGTGQIAWLAESGKSAGICFVDVAESSLAQIGVWLGSQSSTNTAVPSELNHTFTEPVETGMAGQAEEILRRAQAATGSPAPSAPPALLNDEPEMDHGKIVAEPENSAPEQVVALVVETEDRNTFGPSANWESKTPVTALAPSVNETEAPTENEEIATAPENRAEDSENLRPSPANTFHSFLGRDSSATSLPRFSGMASNVDGAAQLLEPVSTTGGLNDPLPTFTLRAHTFSVSSTPELASHVLFRKFDEIGWAFEHDWHMSLGMLFLLGGFAALWQHPPMLLLGIGLWTVGGLILTGRKSPPADREHPGNRRNKGAN